MSPKEGIFYAGVMIGLIVCVTGARMLQLHNLIGLAVGVIAGAGLGYLAQQAYIKLTTRDDPQDRDFLDR
jgi:hypothetical protein